MESKGSRCFFFSWLHWRGCSRIFPCPAKVHDLKFAIPQAKVQNRSVDCFVWWWWWWWGWGCKACFGVGGLRVLPFFLSIFLTGCSFGGDRSVCPSVVINLFGRCLVFLCAFYCCPMAVDYPYMDNEWSKRKGGWIWYILLESSRSVTFDSALDIWGYTVYIHQNQHLCWGWSSTQ